MNFPARFPVLFPVDYLLASSFFSLGLPSPPGDCVITWKRRCPGGRAFSRNHKALVLPWIAAG
jgi:hypothetical protein